MDREIVIQAREGDHDAFARLVAASIGRLNAIARLIHHDYTAAEDAVQEALVDVWRDLRSLRDPDRFDAWLTRILVRACQDARRRVRRRGLMELQIDLPVGFAFDDALRDRRGPVAAAGRGLSVGEIRGAGKTVRGGTKNRTRPLVSPPHSL